MPKRCPRLARPPILALGLALSAFPCVAHATVSFVQEIGAAESWGFYPPPPPSAFPDGQLWIDVATPIQAGNRILVSVAMDPVPGTVTCTDGQDNPYTIDADVTSGAIGSGVRTVVCSGYVRSEVPVADKILVVHPVAAIARSMTATEFAGLAGPSLAVDALAVGSGSGIALSAGPTEPPTRTHQFVFGAFGTLGIRDFTAGNSYSGLASKSTTAPTDDSNVSVFSEYLVGSGMGAFTADATMDLSGSWAGAVVAYADVCSNLDLPPATECDPDAEDARSMTVRRNTRKADADSWQVDSVVSLPSGSLADEVLAGGIEFAIDVQNGTFGTPFAAFSFDPSDCKAIGAKGAKCKSADGSIVSVSPRRTAFRVTARIRNQAITLPSEVPLGIDVLLSVPSRDLALPGTIRRCSYRNKDATLTCKTTG